MEKLWGQAYSLWSDHLGRDYTNAKVTTQPTEENMRPTSQCERRIIFINNSVQINSYGSQHKMQIVINILFISAILKKII